MLSPRNLLPLLAIASVSFFSFLFYTTNVKESWRGLPQKVGLGETISEPSSSSSSAPSSGVSTPGANNAASGEGSSASEPEPSRPPRPKQTWSSVPKFEPGVGMPADYNFSTVLVIPRTSNEDVGWIDEFLPEYQTAIYVADDSSAPLHPPKNKGHEVMIYLTWVIDNYADLPDIAVFMHAHRYAWHNADMLDLDSVQMVKRLNPNRVLREGYMNMLKVRHPGEVEDDIQKHEQKLLAKAWSEIFPLDPIPEVLAQPCCAQFALSRDRIRSIPLQRFVAYRDWLLRTPLSDALSGRIWEYIWQYVFTGRNVYCPIQHVCYCDGFGVCFGDEEKYKDWTSLRFRQIGYEYELRDWHDKERLVEQSMEDGNFDELADIDIPEVGRDVWLEEEIESIKQDLKQRRDAAIERGNDPRIRALDSGREWKEGDWF
ncbi:hypothetical protein SLS55_000845 [Diplodia seriata]|uniref:Uncharacterized protein n=1 Tax=Diplodia seriata TaxID=420778 RepID=A0ABR3CVG9_9PEZI